MDSINAENPGLARREASASPLTQRIAPWALLLGALLILYVPTVINLATGLWQTSSHSHGPIVLAAAIWLIGKTLGQDFAARNGAPFEGNAALGAPILAIGLLFYAIGRSQSFASLEVSSAIPVLLGGVLMLFGTKTALRLWFSFVFLLFLIPLPAALTDAITQPLKIAVSYVTESLLYALGYPIARSGVVLAIGQYQLLVADACSGLNSLFMLEAFGLLYLNTVRHASVLRNLAMAALVIPISFVSNVVRVILLTLITFYFGDATAQGFIHSFSGIVLFASALMLTIGADVLLRAVSARREKSRARARS